MDYWQETGFDISMYEPFNNSFNIRSQIRGCVSSTQSVLRKVMQISSSIGNRPHPPALIAVFDHFWSFFWQLPFIFHKTEVQTVILRCWTAPNLNWFKSYGTKCKYFFLDLANSQNDKFRFVTISSHFFDN